VIGVIKTKLDW